MLLTVSVGNSRTIFGIGKTDRPGDVFRLPSERGLTSDGWMERIESALAESGNTDPISAIVLASVVPVITERLLVALPAVLNGVEPLVVDARSPLGMTVRYDPPQSLGSDRFINAFAVWRRFLGPAHGFTRALVIDCGTATTFGLVTRDGLFEGGSILPGIGISREALLARTAQLPDFELVDAPLIATNTRDALRAGIIHGFSAQIDGMIERYSRAVGGERELLLVGTGGALSVVLDRIRPLHRVEAELPLIGLQAAYAVLTGSDETT
ncbi:MAG: type III pantothenate kinase [Capsulimonadales bacterium]|nr:type III pantothenate kinase [Capsulimonadales bacterium]